MLSSMPQRRAMMRSSRENSRTSLARPSATMTTTTASTSDVSPRSLPVSRSCPSPPDTNSSSPAMSERSANVQPILAPPRIPGSAAGSVTVSIRRAPRAPIVRAARSIDGRHVAHRVLGRHGDRERGAEDDHELDGPARSGRTRGSRAEASRSTARSSGRGRSGRRSPSTRRERASAIPSGMPIASAIT